MSGFTDFTDYTDYTDYSNLEDWSENHNNVASSCYSSSVNMHNTSSNLWDNDQWWSNRCNYDLESNRSVCNDSQNTFLFGNALNMDEDTYNMNEDTYNMDNINNLENFETHKKKRKEVLFSYSQPNQISFNPIPKTYDHKCNKLIYENKLNTYNKKILELEEENNKLKEVNLNLNSENTALKMTKWCLSDPTEIEDIENGLHIKAELVKLQSEITRKEKVIKKLLINNKKYKSKFKSLKKIL
jgi:hypothetical protein